jgi:indolepyruvate ferredoxin oxidoreductase
MFERPLTRYYHFHPPLLRAMGMQHKLKLGPWFDRPLRLLLKLKRLRGGVLDIFGYAHVRRQERQLMAVVIANAPDGIRGYEDIKLRRIAETKDLVAQHVQRFTSSVQAEAFTVLPNA